MVIYCLMSEHDKNMEIDANKSNVDADGNDLDPSRKRNMAGLGNQCIPDGAPTNTRGSNETPPKALSDTCVI